MLKIMGSSEEDIIDLTNSFTLINHSNLQNEIIVIDSDDSFSTSANISPKPQRKRTRSSIDTKSKNTHQIGTCPICWEELGKNSLAATKCGHVFCLQCLKQSLQQLGRKCPSCRKNLKGASSYHRLYLNCE